MHPLWKTDRQFHLKVDIYHVLAVSLPGINTEDMKAYDHKKDKYNHVHSNKYLSTKEWIIN